MKIDLEEVNKIVYPDRFQPRQWDVLRLKLLSYTVRQMADKLGLSEHTINDRMLEVRQILGFSDGDRYRKQKELIQWAIDHGLITINF